MRKKAIVKSLIYTSIFILTVDFLYKYAYNITYQTRENCILYRSLPKIGFLFYEYFIELSLILIVGIFVAVMLESFFSKFSKLYPKNPITAFIYASVLPVCSCGALPIVESLNGKMKLRTLLTFVVAAPLLNPYIIVLSYSVLGLKYTVLRILGSFFLAISSGYVVEFFFKKDGIADMPINCNPDDCAIPGNDIYLKTFNIFKKASPYLLIAAFLGMALEYYTPAKLLQNYDLNNNIYGLLLVIVIGVPVYFCNGADVLILKPLMFYSGLPMGTALAFSLTSTSVCFTSLVLMVKFLGKKATLILLINVIIIVFLIGWLINVFY